MSVIVKRIVLHPKHGIAALANVRIDEKLTLYDVELVNYRVPGKYRIKLPPFDRKRVISAGYAIAETIEKVTDAIIAKYHRTIMMSQYDNKQGEIERMEITRILQRNQETFHNDVISSYKMGR